MRKDTMNWKQQAIERIIAYNPHNELATVVKFSSAYLTIGAGGGTWGYILQAKLLFNNSLSTGKQWNDMIQFHIFCLQTTCNAVKTKIHMHNNAYYAMM